MSCWRLRKTITLAFSLAVNHPLPSQPNSLSPSVLARGKIVNTYDDETEVFNLANRCLETSISDPKTWELLAIRGGIEGSGWEGEGRGWFMKRKKTSILSFTCSKRNIDWIRPSRPIDNLRSKNSIVLSEGNSLKILYKTIIVDRSNEERKETFKKEPFHRFFE